MTKTYTKTGIQILEAAKELFADSGYHAVSTKKIAQKAQVNEVTIFRLFETKEKLFESLLEHFFLRPSFSRIESIQNLPLGEFLRELGALLHEFFIANLTLIKIEIRERDRIYNKRNLSNFSKVTIYLTSQFQKYKQMSAEQAEREAFCFMTGVHGMLLNLYIFRSINDKMKFEDSFETLVSKYE